MIQSHTAPSNITRNICLRLRHFSVPLWIFFGCDIIEPDCSKLGRQDVKHSLNTPRKISILLVNTNLDLEPVEKYKLCVGSSGCRRLSVDCLTDVWHSDVSCYYFTFWVYLLLLSDVEMYFSEKPAAVCPTETVTSSRYSSTTVGHSR